MPALVRNPFAAGFGARTFSFSPRRPIFSFELHFEFMCGQWLRLHFVSLIIIVSVYIMKSVRRPTSKHTYKIVVARLPGRTCTSSLCKVKLNNLSENLAIVITKSYIEVKLLIPGLLRAIKQCGYLICFTVHPVVVNVSSYS